MAVITYKCPGCSGPLTWDGSKQKYTCEYCKSEYTEEELQKIRPEGISASAVNDTHDATTASIDIDHPESHGTENESDRDRHQKMRAYNCPSCGAQVVTDDTTVSTFCYYCHNPLVLSDRVSGEFNPDYIIPFAFDKKKALEIFRSWVSKHRYIPSDFYSEEQIEKLSGVYFPYWVYNCKVKGSLRGQGDILRTWTDGVMQHTETSVYDISRDGDMPVDGLSRIALKKASKVLCESVMPFNDEGMKPFSMAYLQGYVSEMRDIVLDEIEEDVRAEVRSFAEDELRSASSNGYNSVEIKSLDTSISDESFMYALMPVFTLTYGGKGDSKYYFSINGQTGKTCGELPVDRGKLLRLFFFIFVPALLLFLLVFYFVI